MNPTLSPRHLWNWERMNFLELQFLLYVSHFAAVCLPSKVMYHYCLCIKMAKQRQKTNRIVKLVDRTPISGASELSPLVSQAPPYRTGISLLSLKPFHLLHTLFSSFSNSSFKSPNNTGGFIGMYLWSIARPCR